MKFNFKISDVGKWQKMVKVGNGKNWEIRVT